MFPGGGGGEGWGFLSLLPHLFKLCFFRDVKQVKKKKIELVQLHIDMNKELNVMLLNI